MVDKIKKDLLKTEIDRLMKEGCAELSNLEATLVIGLIVENVKFMHGVPNKYKSIIYDILHKYALIVEGLEK
jgi:hypothetical protein